uniref:Uncharacterized protein n=2 Tax=Helianthus annuus TaxID=4232 RepID=A0A251U6Z1_HELAN
MFNADLILLAFVLSEARMKFVGFDESTGSALTQGFQIDHSFHFLESLNEDVNTEYRERPPATYFLDYFYFPRELQPTEGCLLISNMMCLFPVILFNRWLFVIHMYILINPGVIYLWGHSCLECSHSFTISWSDLR